MRRRVLVAGLVAPLVLAACSAQPPPTRESTYEPLPVDRPTRLEVPATGSAVWADEGHAADVRCWVTPEGGDRQELIGHYLRDHTRQPTTRSGRRWHRVGVLDVTAPVTVECEGPASADLEVQLVRP